MLCDITKYKLTSEKRFKLFHRNVSFLIRQKISVGNWPFELQRLKSFLRYSENSTPSILKIRKIILKQRNYNWSHPLSTYAKFSEK